MVVLVGFGACVVVVVAAVVGFVACLAIVVVVAAAVVLVLVGFVACVAVVAASVVLLYNSGRDAEARPGRGCRSHIRCI